MIRQETMARAFHAQDVPLAPGVYVFRNRAGEVIYVGKAKILRRRLASYFQPSQRQRADAKLRALLHSIWTYEFQVTRTEAEALVLEDRWVKEYVPRYNVDLRDDKRFLLIAVAPEGRFPRLELARLTKQDGRSYYGPFPHARAVRDAVRLLSRRFQLRTCRTLRPGAPQRRCLDQAFGQCCGPCRGTVTTDEYAQRLAGALSVLEGHHREFLADVEAEMRAHAAAQEFEEAARLRDVIESLRAARRAPVSGGRPRDRRAHANTALARLQQCLELPDLPVIIEGFDVSNIAGCFSVASMVRFRDGHPSVREYRHFRIQGLPEGQSNDFAMMAEVVERRFRRLLDEQLPLPSLVVIDGGAGQVHAAASVLAQLHCQTVPVIGLAKRLEEIWVPGRPVPLRLKREDPALQVLQHLRDEAHRFALSYHTRLRRRRIQESILDDIDGIGPQRKLELLRAFGSLRRLHLATPEEIAAAVPGIGADTAQRVAQALDRCLDEGGSGMGEVAAGGG